MESIEWRKTSCFLNEGVLLWRCHGLWSSKEVVLQVQLFLVNERLQFVVLALNHLSHGLIEEVLGLVCANRLVADGSISGRHS